MAVNQSASPVDPTISLVIPAYNEETILSKNLSTIYEYMENLEGNYSWEIIIVNDGSHDNTGPLADQFAASHDRVRVIRSLLRVIEHGGNDRHRNWFTGILVCLVLENDVEFIRDHLRYIFRIRRFPTHREPDVVNPVLDDEVLVIDDGLPGITGYLDIS